MNHCLQVLLQPSSKDWKNCELLDRRTVNYQFACWFPPSAQCFTFHPPSPFKLEPRQKQFLLLLIHLVYCHGLTSNWALNVLKTPSQRLPDCVSTWTMSPTCDVAACMKCALLYTPSGTTRPRGDLLQRKLVRRLWKKITALLLFYWGLQENSGDNNSRRTLYVSFSALQQLDANWPCSRTAVKK